MGKGLRVKAADVRYCPGCGSEVHREWLFCYLCGSSLPSEARLEYERRRRRKARAF